MRTIIASLLIAAVMFLLGAGAVIYAGWYDVAATTPHWPATAWNDHSDDELWATVGFLQKLPGMSEEDYARLVMAHIAHGGHHH